MARIRDRIIQLADKNEKITARSVLDSLSNGGKQPSRQYLNRVIRQLIQEGALVKGGSTRGAFYVHPKNADVATAMTRVHLRLMNDDLKEHEVLEDVRSKALFFSNLRRNVQDIFNYSFSEMLNNAIEHSDSETIEVTVTKDKENLYFEVNDMGIGVFKSIMTKRHLESEIQAVQDLLKGKTTTMPQAHSGEGIFFTSKMGDVFLLDSFEYRLRIDNQLKDVFLELEKRPKKGTRVLFRISLHSNRHTSDIFKKYQSDPEISAFDKTEVQIKLYTMGTIHVSRSQARRLLSGLDKFKKVILDFDKVPTVGQGFTDEIFRVFQARHPDIQITAINTNEAVQFMIDRVEPPQPELNLQH
jgi:anti-sigma regulatory factor (Ser/Thr protein kinase)